jgi:hypothetical protein
VAAAVLLVLELLSGRPPVTTHGPLGPSASHPA